MYPNKEFMSRLPVEHLNMMKVKTNAYLYLNNRQTERTSFNNFSTFGI